MGSVRRLSVAITLAATCLVPAYAAPPGAPVQLPADCSADVPGSASNLLVASRPGADSGPSLAPLGGVTVGHIPILRVVEAHFASPAAARAAARLLAGDPTVAWVEPEQRFSVLGRPVLGRSVITPNDPLFGHQWALRAIHAPQAWPTEVGTTSPVVAAVLDTGIDLQHPDLNGRVTAGPNFAAGNMNPQDDNSHGTHVAGIIAADANNSLGIAGIDWGVRLLAVKVMAANGTGTTCDITAGMVAAVQSGARVLNMSIAGPGPCPIAFLTALQFATQRGTLAVAAAGNAGDRFNPPMAPADCPGVIAVAATDQANRPAVFSNYGSYVTVAAPGVHILSTYIDVPKQRHAFAYLDGTSMAAPFVTGLAALLFSEHPSWTPADVRNRIVSTARDLGARGWDPHYGYGLIDVAKALG